jgi:phosphomannomutase
MPYLTAVSALLSTGCLVSDLGICFIPILQFMVKKFSVKRAILISAGHNDAYWNALTFISQDGTYLNEYQGEEILHIYHSARFHKAPVNNLGKGEGAEVHFDLYFKCLTEFIESGAIQKENFKVVVDPCNGAGAGIVDLFCHSLNYELIPVHNKPTQRGQNSSPGWWPSSRPYATTSISTRMSTS